MSYVSSRTDTPVDLFYTAPLPSFFIDADTYSIIKASASAYQFFAGMESILAFPELITPKETRKLIDYLDRKTSFKDTFYVSAGNGLCIVTIAATYIAGDVNSFYSIVLSEQTDVYNKLQEYRHYIEQSSEAVWRYEFKEPISINCDADTIIAHIRKHAYLAECNDRFAIMYGFTSAQELMGTPLELVFDFSIEENVLFLKSFIEHNYVWVDAERTFIEPNGTVHYFISNLIGNIKNNMLTGGWGNQREISEKKKIELALIESENRFRLLADTVPAMIWICDEHNVTTYVNRSWMEFTGVDLTYKRADAWATIIHPEDKEEIIATCGKAADRKEPVTVTYRIMHHSGVYKWVVDTSTPRFDSKGQFIGYIGSVIDITEQKQQEEQLQYQSTLFENVSDLIVTTDLNFNIRSWNKVAQNYYGITEKEALGKSIGSLLTFTYINDTQELALQTLLREGKWTGTVEFDAVCGERKTFLQTVTYVYDKDNNKIGVMSMGRDITEIKKAEQKLEQSELFYKSLIKDSLDGMLLTNPTGEVTFVSPSIKNILGYEVEDVLGRRSFEFVHPEDLAWAAESFEREVTENPIVKSISVRLLKKNGEWLWCMVRGHNLLSNPYIKSVVLYIHDDTLRKNAKDALVKSEKQFRNLISELQVGVIMQNAKGEVTLCNKTGLRILGVSEEEILGKKTADYLSDVIHENGRKYRDEEFVFATISRTKSFVRNKVMGIWHPILSTRVWIMVNAEPVFDEAGEFQSIVCSFNDITERKWLEQKLIAEEVDHQRQLTQATIDGQEQERKEIGKELHDNIGQQLTTTKLYLDLAKSTADDSTNELISLALKSVSDVINEIRSISHSLVPPSLGDLGLEESLRELTDSVRRTQLLKIKLDFYEVDEEAIPDNKKLMIYRIVQEQLNNIVKHAHASEIYINIINDEQHYLLEVKDNGNGFDVNKVRKGLGLTNIRNRAELFGGKVSIITAPGKGCHLKVILPHSTIHQAS